MRFETSTGEVLQDVTICAACGCVSTDLDMTICPLDGAVLGETSMTDAEIRGATPPVCYLSNRFPDHLPGLLVGCSCPTDANPFGRMLRSYRDALGFPPEDEDD